MNPNKPSRQAPDETLLAKKAALETEALTLIEDAERRLKHEKNLETLKALDLRRQDLKNILTGLMLPRQHLIDIAENRLRELMQDPLSAGSHSFLLAPRNGAQSENGANP